MRQCGKQCCQWPTAAACTAQRKDAQNKALTALFVKLSEDLADDLAHALQRLEVVLCFVVLPFELFCLVPQVPDFGVNFFMAQQLFPQLVLRFFPPGVQDRRVVSSGLNDKSCCPEPSSVQV